MIKSKYHPELTLLPCPNCNSIDVQEGGDDFDGDVCCNTCNLCTQVYFGTKNAIKACNSRNFNYVFLLNDDELTSEYLIII